MLTGRRWFDEHGVSFTRHYTGSLACVPSRPTIFTGQYPDLHGVTQTDGIGKAYDDSRMRWLRPGEVPTLGQLVPRSGLRHPLRRQVAHLPRRPGRPRHREARWPPMTTTVPSIRPPCGATSTPIPLAPYGFSGWVGPEPHGAGLANSGLRRDPLIADRVVAWLRGPLRPAPRR